MGTPRQMLNLLEQLTPQRMEAQMFREIKKAQKVLRELNAKKQLFERGVDRNNRVVGRYKRTGKKKSGKIQTKGSPYDFFDTEKFIKGFFIRVERDSVSFWSSDPKAEKLVEIYGDIMGLTDDSLKVFIRDNLYPVMMRYIRKSLRIRR